MQPSPRPRPQSSRRAFLRVVAGGMTLPLCSAEAISAKLTAAEPAAVAAIPGSNPVESDVGTLFNFIQSQAVQGEFPLSFLQPRFQSLAEWKSLARRRVFDLLHYAPRPVEPRPEVVESVDEGDYVREKVYFNTTPDVRVPACVLVPKNRTQPAPGIVALHDHGGFYLWGKEKLIEHPEEHPVLTDFKKTYYGGKSIASELARQGYVVLVIDMFYWGERRMLLNNDAFDWQHPDRRITPERIAAFNQRAGQNEQLVGRTIFAAGFTWAGVMFWDDIRSVDYLASRPEVDRNRIGCVGLSVGGLRSCHLAALDERIKVAVAVGWMCSFRRQLQKHIRYTIGHTKLVPGLYREMDYPDVAALTVPRPLLVINGRKDGLFEPTGVQEAFEKLKASYAKAGHSDRFQARLYDTPHEFNLPMQQEAWDWLKRWI